MEWNAMWYEAMTCVRPQLRPTQCCTYYKLHPLVSLLHFRFDLIEVRLQLFHVRF